MIYKKRYGQPFDTESVVGSFLPMMSYVIPWSSIPQELQQPLRRYVAQADGKLCGYCKENLCNTENRRMIVELYLGKQEHHVSRILY